MLAAYREAVAAELTRAIMLARSGDLAAALVIARRFDDEPTAQRLISTIEGGNLTVTALDEVTRQVSG